jgi:hypothetical protein
MAKPVKSTSLKELGYTIKADKGKDEKGNTWAFKVIGPAPIYYVRKSKRGRLAAFRSKDSQVESTIEGLYNFKEKDDDLVGQRASVPPKSKKAQSA